jgi:hypothetical protein
MRRRDFLRLAAAGSITGRGGTRGGSLVAPPVSAAGVAHDDAGPLAFTTPQGWQVRLETAKIALGPI